MDDYFSALTNLQYDLICVDTSSSYDGMRFEAYSMLAEAKTAVWDKRERLESKD